jgi:hypothetical protein
MDTVYQIRLRSYGFLHPGREQLRTDVLKRAWSFIPGSTLYGAVAAALIRLDGIDPHHPYSAQGGFHDLLRQVKTEQIRFTPLVPALADEFTATAYSQAALYRTQPLFQTIPHAPISRPTEHIHGDQLYAFSMHRPVIEYVGYVFGNSATETLLRRALRLLPIIPLGGKGKFSLVEGQITMQQSRTRFERDLQEALTSLTATDGIWLQLLTPMLLQEGAENWLLVHARESMVSRVQRYRIWQSGTVFDLRAPNQIARRGIEAEEEIPIESILNPGGEETRAVTGIPEGSRFRMDATPQRVKEIAQYFITGLGHPGWAYAGWGQVVIEWPRTISSSS